MSVPFYGDYDTTETVDIPVNTFTSDDPSASVTVTDLVAGDVEIHKDGSTTQRASDNGVTVSIDFDGVTGNHMVHVDLSDNSDAGYYANGSRFQVRIEGVTIDGATVNAWIGVFSIGCTLRPATAGRTLAVESDGVAHADVKEWLGVAPLALSNQQVQAVVPNTQKVDVETIKTQAVTCGAGVTVYAYVGTPAVPGAAGGAFIAGTNAETTITTALNANIIGNITGNLSGSVGSVTTKTGFALADGSIVAATFAADAIAAAAIATGAFTADAFAANALVAGTFAASSLDDKGNWNTVTPDAAGTAPTAVEIQAEMEENGASILDTLRDDLADGGRLDLLIDAIKVATDRLTAARAGVLTDLIDGGRLDLILDAIVADSNELQTDWADGGRLDTILDAVTGGGTTNLSVEDREIKVE